MNVEDREVRAQPKRAIRHRMDLSHNVLRTRSILTSAGRFPVLPGGLLTELQAIGSYDLNMRSEGYAKAGIRYLSPFGAGAWLLSLNLLKVLSYPGK